MINELVNHLGKNKTLAMLPAWPEEYIYWPSADSNHLQVTAIDVMSEVRKILTDNFQTVLDPTITLTQVVAYDTRVTFSALFDLVKPYTDALIATFADSGQSTVQYLVTAIKNQVTDFEMTVNSYISTYVSVGPLLNLIRAGQSIELALCVLDCLPSHSDENGPVYCPVVPPGPIELYDLVSTRRGFTVRQRAVEILSNYDHIIEKSGNIEMILYWKSLKNMSGNKSRLTGLGYANF